MKNFVSLLTAVSVGAIAAASGASAAIVVTPTTPSGSVVIPTFTPGQEVNISDEHIEVNTLFQGNANTVPNGLTSIDGVARITVEQNGSLSVIGDGTNGSAFIRLQTEDDSFGRRPTFLNSEGLVSFTDGASLTAALTQFGSINPFVGALNSTTTIDGATTSITTNDLFILGNSTTTMSGGASVLSEVAATANISNGIQNGEFGRVQVGTFGAGPSQATDLTTLRVTGDGSFLSTGSNFSVIADAGTSQFIIEDGARIEQTSNPINNNSLVIEGWQSTGSAEVILSGVSSSGSRSTISVDNRVFVGSNAFSSGTGSLTIEDGALLEATGGPRFLGNVIVGDAGARSGTNQGILTLNSGGQIIADSIGIYTRGTLTGDGGIISADVVLDGGTIAPGNSPGILTIDGDLDVVSGILEFEFGGNSEGTYDVLNVFGDMFVSDMTTFSFSFIDGFAPMEGDTFDFLNIGGTNNLDLALFNVVTDGLLGDLNVDLGFSNGMFSATILSGSEVPIPGALPLMMSGLAGMGWLSRRRRAGASA